MRASTPSTNPRKKPATMPTIVASTIVMSVASAPTSSELRPPYSNRTAMSRPFWSAPSRKRPCHVGPIGWPVTETTFSLTPPTVTVSVTWLAFGVVCATCSA